MPAPRCLFSGVSSSFQRQCRCGASTVRLRSGVPETSVVCQGHRVVSDVGSDGEDCPTVHFLTGITASREVTGTVHPIVVSVARETGNSHIALSVAATIAALPGIMLAAATRQPAHARDRRPAGAKCLP